MQTAKKYTDRPSPPYKANDYKNEIKKGNDDNKYKSVKDSNGVYKWKLIDKPKYKKYYIHDNGSTNFLVEDYDNKVIIYKITKDYDNNTIEINKKIKEIKYQEIYFGKVPSKMLKDSNYSYEKGNTILLMIDKGKYIFIGQCIYSFETKDKEKIIKFVSPIGNSDVPYPYAIGENNTYLLLENIYIDNSLLDLNEDIYQQYYQYHYINIKMKNKTRYKKLSKNEKEKLLEELTIYEKIYNSAKKIKSKMIVKRP
jgi:hypothetical protein